jgi:His/Glu/Gln/Arg/opine family amino acid ABC transporter permease subunit
MIGVVIGSIIAIAKYYAEGNKKLKFISWICDIYTTVIRGIPVTVLLMIFYFIIIVSDTEGITTAIIAFGINSGAYVAEIFRGGIMSIDNGQFEAGRSLGFNYFQTMLYIITPQVIKTTLPTLCNEFIVLLKETSVAGYVGIMDLTKAGELIRGRTFSAFMPLIAVALIYLVVVIILTRLVKILERRLRKNER